METDRKRLGRPPGTGKADQTLKLFDGVNPAFPVDYSDTQIDHTGGDSVSPGPVGGGDAGPPPESDEALLSQLWALGHDKSVPASARSGALVKYSQAKERLQARQSGGDVRPELEAFLRALGSEHPADCSKRL